jgi:hypothetical protein
MKQNIQTKLSNVDLNSLALRLSKKFNLRLTFSKSKEKLRSRDIDLILEQEPKFECLTISRNYSEDIFDYEQFAAYHYPGGNEQTHMHYHSSKQDYFKKMFHDVKGENEFLSSIKRAYEEILMEWSKISKGGIHYSKRISNDQKALEEVFNYAALNFKGEKSSI